jgi:hypothetical protein
MNIKKNKSASPIKISSQTFLIKNACMNNSKPLIEQEAKRLGILLKDDCGKNKTKQKLCDEIKEKYSPVRISSRKCSPVRISSLQIPKSFSNKSASPIKISSQTFLIKNACMNNSKPLIEQEAKRLGISLKDDYGKIKTKQKLCDEIKEKYSPVRISSRKCSPERISSRKCSPERILSSQIPKSFSNKSDCMKHLKPPIEQEAKRLGISLKDDCGKIKTKQQLCDEINEKYSPVRISSRKCSPERISSSQIPKSFSNKSDCMKHLKSPIEQEAKRLGISLKDDCGKNKTKQKLCDEINEKYSPERISSRKCSPERILSSQIPKSFSNKSASPIKISSQTFLIKNACMNNSKPLIEQEAKRLGISLKDDCGKIKTKQKLCDEIKEKYSPVRISSRKCSPERISSPQITKSFSNKSDCMKHLKPPIEQEAKRLGISLKDDYGKNKTKQQLCDEIKKNYKIFKKKDISAKEISKNRNNIEKKSSKYYDMENDKYKTEKNFINCEKCITCQYAAFYGHLECLKYLHQNNYPWDEWTFGSAAANGHLDCLKYLHENNCPWNEYLCSYAAFNGHLDCLKYLHKNKYFWNEYTCQKAAMNGHIDCLEYARKNGCPWNKLTFEGAASNGQLECLEYLYKNNCPWDEWTCISAVENGHLKCLRYLHENNCPWTELACQYAAKNGHLKCLKYLHENGCLWNANTCLEAAKNGHLECLKYAVEKGCPWDKNDCKKNTSYDLILKFIENFQ